ncbi:MAG: uroporphyrinogen-III synthase [Sphingomonas bacterium]|nr:uroporphyrinogen-III synthase [Sphingomonas bacterium]
MVIRPEPGATQTCDRLRAAGFDALATPLFVVGPLAWQPPSLDRTDALLVTSANAMRHGGVGLTALRHLPVVAVGKASAAAARAVGFDVTLVGDRDAAAALDAARQSGYDRLLHVTGRDHIALSAVAAVPVYASDAIDIDARATALFLDATVLLHSARAARHFAALIDRDACDRARIALAALSPAVAEAAGAGWRHIAVAPHPDDDALIATLSTRD